MPQVEVRAALSRETNEPVLGDCVLSVGDSVKIPFKHGRAIVELDVAQKYLVNNADLEIPALGIFRSPVLVEGAAVATTPAELEAALGAPQSVESVTATGTDELVEGLSPEERIDLAKKLLGADGDAPLAELDFSNLGTPREERTSTAAEADPGHKTTVAEAAREGSEPVPNGTAPEDVEQPPEETEQERRIREAQEHLREEGEEPAEPDANAATRVVPDGFEATTAEGEPRCLAKKADGKQCKNAAKDDSPACQMPAHQEQFAS